MSFIEKGSEVVLSIKGHKGFFYPDPNSIETLIADADVIQLIWVGSIDLLPVLVPETSIFASGDSKNMIPVWIKKEMLKSVKAT